MTIHYKKMLVDDFIQLVKNQLSIKNLEATDDEISDIIKTSLKEDFQDIRWIQHSLSAESIGRIIEFGNVIANELIETKEAGKENIMTAETTQTTETGKKGKKGWVKTTAKLFGLFAAGFGAGFAIDRFVMKPGKKESK